MLNGLRCLYINPFTNSATRPHKLRFILVGRAVSFKRHLLRVALPRWAELYVWFLSQYTAMITGHVYLCVPKRAPIAQCLH